ncbi:MAG: hypothetical protein K0V04_06305 [Deltaproteobacteria bacterium]|nr:hypothetical protein [Deltaproteobacteria bacterium]
MVGIAALALLPACADSGDGNEDGAGTEAASDAGTAGSGSGAAEGEPTAGVDLCEGVAETNVVWAINGNLVPPMELAPSELGIEVARSWIGEQGTAELAFEIMCDGPVYFWGLVWDADVSEAENPDSYYIHVDGGAEATWNYGCSNGPGEGGSWNWITVDAWREDCDQQRLELVLEAGMHTVVIRNREAGTGANVAALAGLVFSHDPDIDPTVYTPTPE